MQYLDKNGVTKLWNAIKQKFETKDSAEQTKVRISSAEGSVNQLSNSVRSVQIAVTELKNAKQPKLYIAYSSSSDGTGMTLTPRADSSYIGFCTSVDDIAPTTPSRYKWALFKGQGGSGGTSVYTWVAYASDNDGTDFSHTYNGETHDWIGLGLNKPSLTASNDYHDYEWHCITDPNATAKINQLEGKFSSLSTAIQSVQTSTEAMIGDAYQAVEQAVAQATSTVNALKGTVDALTAKDDITKDRIISRVVRNKDGISWTVVKYDSGDMHAWGNGQITFPTGNSAQMSAYWWRKVIYVNLPETFRELTSAMVQGAHNGNILSTNDFSVATGASRIEVHMYSPANMGAQDSLYAHFEVRGRWK